MTARKKHHTPLSAVQTEHLRKLMAENHALERKLKASEIVTTELRVRVAQLEEPDKGSVAADAAESAIKDMHRLLDSSADPEEVQLWDERVSELVQILCTMEELDLSNKELTKTVRNQEKRVLGTEDMEIDFSRQIRQMQDDLAILQTSCRRVKQAFEHADRNMKMQAVDIEKRKGAVERLQVKLYGRPIDEIRHLIKEIKELRVLLEAAETQLAEVLRENGILDKEYEATVRMFGLKVHDAFSGLQGLAIGLDKLKGLLKKLDSRMQVQLLTRTNANVQALLDKVQKLDGEGDGAANENADDPSAEAEEEVVQISDRGLIIAGKRPHKLRGAHEGLIVRKKSLSDSADPVQSTPSVEAALTKPKAKISAARWSKLRTFVKASAAFSEGSDAHKNRRQSYQDYYDAKEQLD